MHKTGITAIVACLPVVLTIFCSGSSADQREEMIKAVRKGELARVRYLLDKGTDVNARDDRRRTALMFAAHFGDLELAEFPVDRGADVNAKTNLGWTALMSAAKKGHLDVARFLIEKRADIDSRYYESATPLMLAAGSGHVQVAKLLIEKGADVNAQEKARGWVVRFGGRCGDDDIEGCGYSANGRTPLIFAVLARNTPMVKLLLEKSADGNARDSRMGRTALGWELAPPRPADPQVVELLKSHGAKE